MTYWREEEDAKLKNHVKIHGECEWKKVAVLLEVRSPNSRYLRWINHLKPGFEHKDITDEEFIAIIRLHKQYGPKWAKIAKKLSEGRPDNLKRIANKIKNFWNGAGKRRASELNLEVDIDPWAFDVQTWDHLGQGSNYTLDNVPPLNWEN